ncbi:MAG: PP2C family protein-serine/threonine phosphatase [Vulcanimicrobiota bacterium]
MNEDSIMCLKCATRVASFYETLITRWKEAIGAFPKQLPDELQDSVFRVILDKLIEALRTGEKQYDSCGYDDHCQMLHESGHEMARLGYTIEEVLKKFTRLQQVLWDFLSVIMQQDHALNHCNDGTCDTLTEHESCHYKITLFFQEITGAIALAYVEEMEKIVIEKEEQLQAKEMEIAGTIMDALLPAKIPALPGLELSGKVVAAGTVGGDFWDVSLNEKGELELIVADVMGHGVSAALLVAMIKYLHSAQRDLHMAMPKQMEKLNMQIIADTPEEVYISSLLGRIRRDRKRLTYINAGYPPPILLRNGLIRELKGSDVPLGLFRKSTYTLRTFSIREDDILLFMSDGVFEARNERREFFGKVRLEQVLSGISHLSASEICLHIIREVSDFCNSGKCRDDITVVAVKILPMPKTE